MKKIIIIIIFLFGLNCLFPINLFAQFLGGNADAFAVGSNTTYCSPGGLPQLTTISYGGIADGFACDSNLTYCTPGPYPILTTISYGGIADGFAYNSNLTYCTPGPYPILTTISYGGIADGFACDSNMTYCTVSPPPIMEEISYGGIADGFAYSDNLTYCSPVPLPTLAVTSYGGIADGFAYGDNLTYCIPVPPTPLVILVLGGIGDGFTYCFGSCIPLLPLKLLNFSAECHQNKVNLIWTTSSEINNDYFIIERSADAENFNIIGKIKGAGNSDEPITYSFNDTSPLTGYAYYRLSQYDYNGVYENLDLKFTICDNIDNDINIYPNPVKDKIYIISDFSAVIRIYNPNGSLIRIFNISGINPIINVGDLTNGLYFIEINGNNRIYHKKFIKY